MTTPAKPKNLEALLRDLSPDGGGLAGFRRLPGRGARGSWPEEPLPDELIRRLEAMGVSGLWSHQLEAISAARSGQNVIVSTGTASGKSLCFNLPVFEQILGDPSARALYLYPTKALAQDQLRAIRAFALPQITAATYDGDTPHDERASVRKYAAIVLSNPDMLHFGILPHHQRWAGFFSNLRSIVVDEAHVLRGVFGSHVGSILRRLRRIARLFGADPTFVMASATIGNPAGLAARLVGSDFAQVSEDSSPRGDKLLGFWEPPPNEDGSAGSSNWEAARLLAAFVGYGIRTIAFNRSRKSAELVARHAQSLLPGDLEAKVRPYRAGYLATDRREIEQALFAGELLGVASTTALELGIDVGGLDAVILNGFPGTVAGFWQQSGRSGRAAEESLAVFVAGEDPLDRYYLTHPDVLISKGFESALIDVTNPTILRPHLGCAAYESPLTEEEPTETFGEGAADTAQGMLHEGELVARTNKKSGRRLYWGKRHPPGRDLDIRSVSGAAYSIVEEETGALLGTTDAARAFQQVHPGAVYLHQGENYEVLELDLANRVALVRSTGASYYTQSRETSELRVVDVLASTPLGATEVAFGKVRVTEKVVSFVRRSIATGETVGIEDLDLPEQVLDTQAFWYIVPPELASSAGLDRGDLPGALHAAEHAGIGILPVFAMADRWDIGGLSTDLSPDTGTATVFIYDGYPGGVGIARRGFDQAADHTQATLDAIRDCACDEGCPSCVQSPKCGNLNEPLYKEGAINLLEAMIAREEASTSASG